MPLGKSLVLVLLALSAISFADDAMADIDANVGIHHSEEEYKSPFDQALHDGMSGMAAVVGLEQVPNTGYASPQVTSQPSEFTCPMHHGTKYLSVRSVKILGMTYTESNEAVLPRE